jgi:hypothetical protein
MNLNEEFVPLWNRLMCVFECCFLDKHDRWNLSGERCIRELETHSEFYLEFVGSLTLHTYQSLLEHNVYEGKENITLFTSIIMFYGTDNIPRSMHKYLFLLD